MLVGIVEKSRRVRTARNSFGLVESDMSSPVARPRVVGPVAWLEGLPRVPGTSARLVEREKRSRVKRTLLLGLAVRPFGSDRPRTGHAQGAVCCSPRSILRGTNLIFRFHVGSCYKRR